MSLDEQIRWLDADKCIAWYSSIFNRWWRTSTSLRRPIYMWYRAYPCHRGTPDRPRNYGNPSVASTSLKCTRELAKAYGAPSSFGFDGWLQYKKHTINKHSHHSTWHGTRRRSDIINRWKVRWIGGWLMHRNWWSSQRKGKTNIDWRRR